MTDVMRQSQRIARAYEIVEIRRALAHKAKRTFADRINELKMSVEYQFMPHYFANPPQWRLRLRARNKQRALPDFASVGAIKSGTSDVSTYLLQHPAIMLPLAKEVATTNPDFWKLHYPTLEECARVEREHGKALNGYFAPYMHNVELMEALRRIRPAAKIIVMVRNPIDRAYSQWKWETLLGGPAMARHPVFATFDTYIRFALDVRPEVRVPTRCGYPVLETGMYTKATRMWQERFGVSNVMVVHAGDFFRDPVATTCSIHEFLGIERIPPVVTEVVNRNPLKASPIEPQTAAMLKEFYRPYNAQFYALIGRDLGWD